MKYEYFRDVAGPCVTVFDTEHDRGSRYHPDLGLMIPNLWSREELESTFNFAPCTEEQAVALVPSVPRNSVAPDRWFVDRFACELLVFRKGATTTCEWTESEFASWRTNETKWTLKEALGENFSCWNEIPEAAALALLKPQTETISPLQVRIAELVGEWDKEVAEIRRLLLEPSPLDEVVPCMDRARELHLRIEALKTNW